MKRILALVAAGLVGALGMLLAMGFAQSSFAQSGPPPTQVPSTDGTYGRGAMRGQGGQGQMGQHGQQGGQGQMGQHGQQGGQGQQGQMGGQAESLVGMAAAALGLSHTELIAQLGTDGTIAAALTAGGSDPAAFIDSFVASRAERLDAMVTAGTLTRTDADARLATARSMSTARIYQPFTMLGQGGQSPFPHP